MEHLFIGELEIELIRKDIENVHLSVYPPNGKVRISAPAKMTDDALRLFAVSKLSWIRRKQRNFIVQPRVATPEYKQSETHYFLGKKYLLNVISTNEAADVKIKSGGIIEIKAKQHSTRNQVHKTLTEWYRAQLKELVPGLIAKWESIINVKVEHWHIRQMKTKWGSCNTERKSILLNLELAKKPKHCIEYIIVHEMIHLLERKHNDKFRAQLDRFMPKWRIFRRELNRLPIGTP